MGTIANKIDEIIAKRRTKVFFLEEAQQFIMSAHKSVSQFQMLQSDIKNNPEKFSMFQENPDVIDRISEISTNKFFQKYDEYMIELSKLMNRLSRDSLNISFIGRAGQGKSLIMQKISGLDGSVIPSAKGSDCTGAKSIITNSNVETVEAEISFYSEAEILDIINKYLCDLTNGSIRIYRTIDIPNIDVTKIQEEAENKEKATDGVTELCDNLRVYVEHYNDYKDYIGTTIHIKKDEIEQYVAHYSCHDSQRKYYKYLAVKLANIKTKFPHEDVGKIVLVDTIGIGKTALGVEEEMLRAVENDSDAIVLILRPDVMRYSMDKEVEILKKIQERISKEYTKEMLFWVLNRVENGESNAEGVREIIKKINQRGYAIAKALNVNCFSKEEVENRFLMPILEHLSSNITTVDELLLNKLNIIGKQLFDTFTLICQETDRAFVSSASEDLKRRFHNRIHNTTYECLLGKLRTLYLKDYNKRRKLPCKVLEKEITIKLKDILKSVPSQRDIIALLSYGNINQLNAYETCTDFMRMKIIDNFIQLNTVLEKLVEDMKMQVLHIFTDADKGRLGFICPLNCDSETWINHFIKKVEGEKKYPIITGALRKFQEYTIKVQGFLIHEVREQLDPIDVSLTGMPQIRGSLAQPEVIAEDIEELLKTYAEDIYSNVKIALNNLYEVPNRSMFAAIKDLYDRITYTIVNNDSKVAEEWRYLYEDWMRFIWKEDYQQEGKMQSIAEHWNKIIESLKEFNELRYFTIKE